MKQNRQEFTGTGKVFVFTLRQMIRNKGNIITAVIMLLAALFWIPISGLLGNSSPTDMEIGKSGLKQILYVNDTDYPVDFTKLGTVEEAFSDVPVAEADFPVEDYGEAGHLGEKDALIHVDMDEATGTPSIQVLCIRSDAADFNQVGTAAATLLRLAEYEKAGVTPEQIDVLMAGYSADTETMTSYEETQQGADWGTQFIVQYAYALVLMILGIFTTSFIIQAIIEEKDSKLVELLMVSVKPMALVVGKILAVMVYIFGLLVAMLLCMVLSSTVSSVFLHTASAADTLSAMGLSLDALQISPFLLIVVLVSLLLGYLTFSILSGIAGTSCSTMDDMQAANMNVTMVILAGYMISVFTVNLPGAVIANAVSLIPVVSIFCAPVEYVLGNIGIGVLIASWVIQAVVVWLLFRFCSSIYENLIFYKGKKMKWMDMLRMAKKNKKKEVR
ncbi:MAG: ABC transporter permease [Lachnospiraceae bacterium]|nr:ABC transporter permease [Lachnospiraceae bacterium]